MGINQAIFTSSARGVEKGGGLGIHTYSIGCSALELSEFQQSFCNYTYHGQFEKIPELPTKMAYGKISENRYMLAEVTYLGMDYDKTSGRTGNCLSHMFSFEKADMEYYPMQLYASPDYRRSMALNEVDGSTKVEFLPVLDHVRPGKTVGIKKIQNFLNDKNFRMDFFCNLLGAVIEKDSVHKIIIYDEHENIVMWMAAIQYALPLQCICEISLSTYEYHPMISEFDIRGAVPGLSEGTCEDYNSSGQFYVFDGVEKKYPKFDIDSDFYQYGIQMAMSYAYDSLQAFHKFLKAYSYAAVDKDIYCGFKLFQMVQGGMDSLTDAEIRQAVFFEKQYGTMKTYKYLLSELVRHLENKHDSINSVVNNICVLLANYYDKDLTDRELQDAAALAVRVEQMALQELQYETARKTMWIKLFENISHRHMEFVQEFAKNLAESELFNILAKFCAWTFQKNKTENIAMQAERLFQSYWQSVSSIYWKNFDAVVIAACKKLEQMENEKKYTMAMELFLKVQEMGKGEIAGSGMERLIGIINDSISFVEEKHLRTGSLIRKNKAENSEDTKNQAMCAVEVFNYTQRNDVDLPIAKIRLKHLKKCIEKTYDNTSELSKSKQLRIYTAYPVIIKHITRKEWEEYVHLLGKLMIQYENTKTDFAILLTCFNMEENNKYILLSEFIEREFSYMKKEGDSTEFALLLEVIDELADNGYKIALKKVVRDLKESQRDKISKMLKKSDGERSKAYVSWKNVLNGTRL